MTVDNQTTQTQDNSQTQTQQPPNTTQTQPMAFDWKSNITPDLANSPMMQKFPNTKEGLNEAIKSHLSLEKLLGHEKVPVPKGADDIEGWNAFSKAFKIPEKAEGYGLEDAKVPDHLKGMTFDKANFSEIVHKHKLTPDQAKGLWGAYTQLVQQTYEKAIKDHTEKMTGVINQMKGEWGDAYQAKVELGQMVINKFSDGQEMNDFITSILSQDPRGIKFLAKIGEQFQENKIGDFKYQRHSLTPEEAQREIDNIRRDPNHPYNNPKATEAEHNRAVDQVNTLLNIAKKSKG